MADTEGQLIRQFGVKRPLITLAQRVTFVIGRDQAIAHIDRGSSAMDPQGALNACSL